MFASHDQAEILGVTNTFLAELGALKMEQAIQEATEEMEREMEAEG